MPKRILGGEKVRLRLLQERDIPFVNQLDFDPEVLKWTVNSDFSDIGKSKRKSTKHLMNIVKKKPKDIKIFIIEKNEGSQKLIGYCGLSGINEWNRSAVFFISTTPACWKKGYGKESAKVLLDYAFLEMHNHRMESYVMEFNTQSLEFHRKFGFIEEARFKEARFQNCRFWDKIMFRLLETEWRDLKKRKGW